MDRIQMIDAAVHHEPAFLSLEMTEADERMLEMEWERTYGACADEYTQEFDS